MDRGETPSGDRGADEVVATAHHDFDAETELSTSVLMALDEVPGYDVESSDDVVVTQIDLDALDALFTPVPEAERVGRLRFPVGEYEVAVTGHGEITVAERSTTD